MATQIRGNQIKSGTIEALRLVGTDINTLGTVTTGAWQGSVIDKSYLDSSLATQSYVGSSITALSLGSISTQNANNVTISGGSIAGIADLAVADGGTGASTAAGARTNLGLVIGTDVQAFNAALAAVSAGTYAGADSITTVGTVTSGAWQASQLAANYVPSLNAINAPTAAVSLNSQKITNLATPSADTDAANKAYVDNSQYLRSVKEPVRVRSQSNVTVSAPGAAIDGVTLSSGDRVLLTAQNTGSQNGIYVFNGASAAMTRSVDADSSEEMGPNHYLWVEEGTSADQAFVCTTDAPVVLGTTALSYTKFSGLGQVTAGPGLVKAGNTISVQYSLETPSGAVDGSNAAFVLAHTPATGSLLLFRNGLLMDAGGDFTLSGSTATFGSAPASGDSVRAFYLY